MPRPLIAPASARPAPRRSADIPFRRDGMGRFLPWLVALMVFLATLAAASAQFLASWGARWDSGFSGSVTVQISPLAGQAPAGPGLDNGTAADGTAPDGKVDDGAALRQRVQAVLHGLNDFPGVLNARPLPMADAARLVEPWLGDGALIRDLPLPALIDVTVTPDIDLAALRQRLNAAVPGVTVEEPGNWLKDLQRLAWLAEGVAIAVVLLIGGAAVIIIAFAARAGLAMHQDEVELLHVMGATDPYIARQFAGRMTRLALCGSVPAALIAGATLEGFAALSRNLDGTLLPPLTLPPIAWLWMAAVPAAAVVLAGLVARGTVLRALGRMA